MRLNHDSEGHDSGAGHAFSARSDPILISVTRFNPLEDSYMFTRFASLQAKVCSSAVARKLATLAGIVTLGSLPSWAQEAGGGEAALKLPDLSSVKFLGGIDGHTLLLIGLVFCVLGLLFGLAIYTKLKNLPVHQSMLEISELITKPAKPI